ncbi:glycosyltransferase [Agromyces lapidis]|uniref:Glycosyltransferase n=1 Tax=Agromyces lapidis TaxID=279574 RepID=A0ABV5SRA1_9MICO|nr:glycosyltransferase [Agromyces lapidis]
MRIAITKNTLRVPPTYFAVDHAMRLAQEFDFRIFTMIAEIVDETVDLPVVDAVPLRGLSFRAREYLIPAFQSVMTRRIRQYRPNVIHQHFATWSTPAVGAAVRDRIPMITTLHGADVFAASRNGGGALGWWNRRNCARAGATSARILAVSEYLAGEAVRGGFPAARTEVHYQGIDSDYFTPASEPGSDSKPVIVFVGAVAEHKGIDHLVQASTELGRTREHRLIVVGDGPMRPGLQATSAPHIEFLGPRDRSEIRDLLRGASALALPTRRMPGWREAAGLVLLEAQACGTPVVAYRNGGTPEMLVDGTTGLLVDDGDIRGLGDALRSLIDLEPVARRRMSEAARAFVVGSRSLAVSANELAAHYHDVGA